MHRKWAVLIDNGYPKGNHWHLMNYHEPVDARRAADDAELIQVTHNMPFGIVAVLPLPDELPSWFNENTPGVKW